LTLDSPWLRLAASRRMLDIVNGYLGLWSKLSHADQWYSPPLGSEADRVGSMRWHRDYNDQHLVKVFVYLCDVDEATGPLEYVPGSARGGRWANEWAWQPLSELYPSQAEFERRIPASAVRTLTGSEGSMIFCNTSGFHRGGYVTEKTRELWVFHYVSPAALRSLVERNFELNEADTARLAEVERFAVT
jgi:phytanoyl-CoA dioxygenase PhyH